MTAADIINKYIAFFEEQNHVRIPNSSLVPENDPTTLFTSSGMQPLVPYLLGEKHPLGKRLVNVQNCFRAQDIDEIGNTRHTTFFRMLGNWSLGDYFKKDQIPWMWEFVTKTLRIPKEKLYVTVFAGNEVVPKDEEAASIWRNIFEKEGLNPDERIFYYGVEKNWWSRSGIPSNMPVGEPGGPDTEIFYEFEVPHDPQFGKECHVNCDCGRFFEICNGVFMQYVRTEKGFEELPQKNVDFGGGLERFLAAIENKQDVFQTSLFNPIISSIEKTTDKEYKSHARQMRIITDHMTAGLFIASSGVIPSNKEQGYILRRLIRRGLDNLHELDGKNIEPILEAIAEQYKETDSILIEKFETIKNVILDESQKYDRSRAEAKRYLEKIHGKEQGDELKGTEEISPDDAFRVYTSYGLSPTQIRSLGYTFNGQEFAKKMEEHQKVSRKGAEKKFAGGLADHSEMTIKGHTTTHLMHQALRDVLGDTVHQSGSNITPTRIRFDFNFDRKLTDEEIKKVEDIVNEKIAEKLPVHFEFMPLLSAKEIGAIGLFDEKYQDTVKIYFIGGASTHSVRSGQSNTEEKAYSIEFCGGPHVENTGELKNFKITKQEGLGRGFRRIYATIE